MSVPSEIHKIERDSYVSLRDHFEAVLEGMTHQIKSGDEALDRHIKNQVAQLKNLVDGQATLVAQAHTASKEAIVKAEEATEKRLDLLNKFREQAEDEQKRFLPINVYNEKHNAIQDRAALLETAMSRLYGGLIVVGAIGVANLVKIWFMGH